MEQNNIIIYQDEDGITKVSVKFSDEDIWLTQNQIAEIYKSSQQNISFHINQIYKDKEYSFYIDTYMSNAYGNKTLYNVQKGFYEMLAEPLKSKIEMAGE